MRTLYHLTALSLVLGAVVAPGALVACADSQTDDTGAGVSSVLFIKRQHTVAGDQGVTVDVAGGNGQVLDYDRYVPGGALMLLAPARPDGVLKNITVDFPTAD